MNESLSQINLELVLGAQIDLDAVAQVVAVLFDRGQQDPEVAHILEDRLLRYALEQLLLGAKHATELAQLALSIDEAEFSRWHA